LRRSNPALPCCLDCFAMLAMTVVDDWSFEN
jgi:hypothetical protein